MDSISKRYRFVYSSCVFSSKSYITLGQHELRCRHKKKQNAGRKGKHIGNIQSDYGIQLSELEKGRSDAVFQKESSDSPAAEALTIVPQDDNCV